jgi:pantoate--beta-alanine ligase
VKVISGKTGDIPILGKEEMVQRSVALRREGRGIVLVPTMGYLHEGHLSLIRAARPMKPVLVVSVFVNPTQFGPDEDYQRYPRDMERDGRLAAGAGADIIFAPTVEEMYPEGYQTYVRVEELSRHLCGASRPIHFRGVATVVLKLFNILGPEAAVFGEKDYQQLAVIRRMVRDLDLPVEIVGCPIVREGDGVAMSSRNEYLSPEERLSARSLNRSLEAGGELILGGQKNAGMIRKAIREVIEAAEGTTVDYVSVADPETLEELDRVAGPALLAVAVKIGPTRLIDNRVVSPG